MKKVLSIILSFVFMLAFCGCDKQNDDLKFSQEVTIVKMPSPPKCKTSDSISVANDVIDVLGLIEKLSVVENKINGGWTAMIKLKIDGQEFVYTLGETIFNDADGMQYTVTNGNEILGKITEIYNDIDAPEVDYP